MEEITATACALIHPCSVANYSGDSWAETFSYEVTDINELTPKTAYVTVKVGELPSLLLPCARCWLATVNAMYACMLHVRRPVHCACVCIILGLDGYAAAGSSAHLQLRVLCCVATVGCVGAAAVASAEHAFSF
jgi:hypothetical protein